MKKKLKEIIPRKACKERRVLKTPEELESYVLKEYNMYDTELNALFFDVQVHMQKRDILKTYKKLVEQINGDHLGRYEFHHNEADGIVIDYEFEEFLPEGEYEEAFEGNCKDFLESFIGEEEQTGLFRMLEDENGYNILLFVW